MTMKPYTHKSENGAYKQSREKSSQVALDLIFSMLHMDLDLDLEKKQPNHGKERRLRGLERESTSYNAPLQQIHGQNLSP